jgi:hypothetical protein
MVGLLELVLIGELIIWLSRDGLRELLEFFLEGLQWC